jgi:predicted Zn-ribbon and HTH transcriptional regulator
MSKKVTAKEEKAIIDQLKKDIDANGDIETLNREAIKKIYSPELCKLCGYKVSMLDDGLCGYCANR